MMLHHSSKHLLRWTCDWDRSLWWRMAAYLGWLGHPPGRTVSDWAAGVLSSNHDETLTKGKINIDLQCRISPSSEIIRRRGGLADCRCCVASSPNTADKWKIEIIKMAYRYSIIIERSQLLSVGSIDFLSICHRNRFVINDWETQVLSPGCISYLWKGILKKYICMHKMVKKWR